MYTKKAFSLAEALITLLIVCIIAIVSAPMITKKAKKPMRADVWQKDAYAESAVSVRNGYDVRFGTESDKKDQSIVVVGTLYFKDRDGKVIGWISEDGTSSFGGSAVDMNKMNQLLDMVNNLYSMLKAGQVSDRGSGVNIASSSSSSSGMKMPYAKRPSARKITPKKIQPAKGPTVPAKLGRSSQQSAGSASSESVLNGIDPSQLQNMSEAELQQMLNSLMQMMPQQ